MKKEDFVKAVRLIVNEELRRIIPEMVKKELAENYVRKLMAETIRKPVASVAKTGGLAELLSFKEDPREEEEIPAPLRNSDEGIYDPGIGVLVKENKGKGVRKLAEDLGPLAFVLEGVNPIDDSSNDEVRDEHRSNKNGGLDFSRMQDIIDRVNEKVMSSVPPQMKADPALDAAVEARMKELEARRRRLDVKAT
jgi:hypothetical protein